MKKKVLVISLLALSGALIGSDKPTPQYEFSGKEAVDHLVRNGQCRDCDLSNQDLRAVIAAVNLKYRNRFIFIDLSGANLSDTDLSCATMINANLTNASMTSANMRNVNMTGTNITGADMTDARYLYTVIDHTPTK